MDENPALTDLPPREQELFNMLLDGKSPKEISYELQISTHTVDYYRTKLYRRLGVSSLQELFVQYLPERQKPGLARISGALLNLQPTSDLIKGDLEGNSTARVSVGRETIDGVSIDDVITINTTLAKGYAHAFAGAETSRDDILCRLRRANGIRFRAQGDGKVWRVVFATEESPLAGWASYGYEFGTDPNKGIVVDIPWSDLRQVKWASQSQQFTFCSERIILLFFEAGLSFQGFGSSSLKIFDFETL